VATASVAGRTQARVLRTCAADLTARDLRLQVLDVLRRAVPFDAYAWLITDPETSVGAAPLADVPCLSELPTLIRLKYLTPINRWTRLHAPVATLVRATRGDLSRSRLWRELLSRYDVTDVASMVFRDRFGCWGFLDLWRTAPSSPFTPEEIAFLADIAAPLTTALRRTQTGTFTATRVHPSVPAGPVVLLLSPALVVRAQTVQTQHYLRLLVPPDEGAAPVPAGAYNVAGQLLANESGVDHQPPLARVHLADGVWLTLRAARLDGTPTQDHDIAVSIEACAPPDRVPIFARAHGLTARETQLLRYLGEGLDSKDTAARMYVTEHTVQDHLKSIFAKTGTHNRRGLLARALGS
jgi:DNA-binding CsgD family transcriptional regulator